MLTLLKSEIDEGIDGLHIRPLKYELEYLIDRISEVKVVPKVDVRQQRGYSGNTSTYEPSIMKK
jgi:hypothetical protein